MVRSQTDGRTSGARGWPVASVPYGEGWLPADTGRVWSGQWAISDTGEFFPFYPISPFYLLP
jgi:hypothetical protein